MIEEIKTYEDRKKELIEKGKASGYITYEQFKTFLHSYIIHICIKVKFKF